MEEVEFNPGHRFELEKLGILKPDENRISIDNLVQRTIDGEKAEPVIDIMKMEHAHYTQKLMDIDFTIEDAQKSLDDIHDKKSFNIGEKEVSRVDRILTNAVYQSEILVEAAGSIIEKSPIISQLIQEHFKVINQNQDKIMGILNLRQDSLLEKLKELQTALDNFRSKFQSLDD